MLCHKTFVWSSKFEHAFFFLSSSRSENLVENIATKSTKPLISPLSNLLIYHANNVKLHCFKDVPFQYLQIITISSPHQKLLQLIRISFHHHLPTYWRQAQLHIGLYLFHLSCNNSVTSIGFLENHTCQIYSVFSSSGKISFFDSQSLIFVRVVLNFFCIQSHLLL